MKALAISILLSISIVALGQQKDNSNVSRKVIEGINAKYPHSTLTRFRKKKDSYKATFKWEGKTYVSIYTSDGNWLKTETEILWKDLPDSVRAAYWKTTYRQMKMESIKQVETPAESKLFVFEVNDLAQCIEKYPVAPSAFATEYLVYFNEKGEMLRAEKE